MRKNWFRPPDPLFCRSWRFPSNRIRREANYCFNNMLHFTNSVEPPLSVLQYFLNSRNHIAKTNFKHACKHAYTHMKMKIGRLRCVIQCTAFGLVFLCTGLVEVPYQLCVKYPTMCWTWRYKWFTHQSHNESHYKMYLCNTNLRTGNSHVPFLSALHPCASIMVSQFKQSGSWLDNHTASLFSTAVQ